MAYLGPRDFLIEVQKGNVAGHSIIHKFGRNDGVPTGKTAYLLSALVTVDAAKAADIRFCTRENIDDTSAPMSASRVKLFWDGVLGSTAFNPRSPMSPIVAKSDLWWEARGGGAGTEVSADFELLVVDD